MMNHMIEITDYESSTLRFSADWEEFHCGGRDEDGNPLFGISYFVRAEAPDGVRWDYYTAIITRHLDVNEEFDLMVMSSMNNADAKRRNEALAAHLEAVASPRLNPDRWDYAGACYGSEAYENLGLEAKAAQEERRDFGF